MSSSSGSLSSSSWSEEDLARAMKRADPATTAADAEPGSTEWARMRSVMAAQPGNRPAARVSRLRPALRWAWALPAAAAVTAVVLTIGTLTAAPSYASTPPALIPEPLDATVQQIVSKSVATLRSAPAATATRDALVVEWQLREDGADDPVIVPQWQQWVWNADGTGHLSATAGAPYSVSKDGEIVAPVGDAPEPGTPLASENPQQTYLGFFPDPPPAGSDPQALRGYLRGQIPLAEEPDALAWWGAISALRDIWTLTPAQQAAALEIVNQAGRLSVLGAVTDRFGRDGIALSVASTKRPEFGATVVLDAQSRQIIAADTIYLGGLEQLDVEADSVIEYSAWLLPRPE